MAALIGAWCLGLCLAWLAPVPVAALGPTRITELRVAPRTGTPETVVTVEATVRHRGGLPISRVHVTAVGAIHEMGRAGGEPDWNRGVVYSWSGSLPLGSHVIVVTALGQDGSLATRIADPITIATPSPTPTPKPTASPTPKPTASPTPTPRPEDTASPTPKPVATPRSTAAPISAPKPATKPAGSTARPAATPTRTDADPTPRASAVAAVTTASPRASEDAVAIAGLGTSGSSAGGGGQATGPAGAGPTLPGVVATAMTSLLGPPPVLGLGLASTLAATSTVVGASVALNLFGKRRRDPGAPDSDDHLARRAGTELTVAAVRAMAARALGDVEAEAAATVDPEGAMPRWRRPSLLEARRADPVRTPTVVPRLTFDQGVIGAVEGFERRLIRYSLVRLLDTPDELRGTELAFLDQGDEVQLLEKRGVYWLVLCPDGRQGWIHKMTLGETVGASAAGSPTATIPSDAETWTMGDDLDGDVLSAYLESRRRA